MSDDIRKFVERLASMPLPSEDLQSTWCPPDWEQIVDWWGDAVQDARKLTGKTYRNREIWK